MTATLDRRRALPLWAQLADDLRARLATGEFDPRFPTEEDLVDQYDVSRPTVRQAVAALVDDGLLTRRRGVGTEVVTIRVEQSLPGSYSLAHAISASGRRETSNVLVCELAGAPSAVAARLGLDAEADAVHVERIRYADNEALAVDRSWFPAEVGAALLTADLSAGSLYDIIAAGGGRPTSGTERIEPVIPDGTDRRYLDLPAREPGFRIHRLLYAGRQPMEDRVSIIRADRYRLTSIWGDR